MEPGNYRSEAGRAALGRFGDVEARAARSRYPVGPSVTIIAVRSGPGGGVR